MCSSPESKKAKRRERDKNAEKRKRYHFRSFNSVSVDVEEMNIFILLLKHLGYISVPFGEKQIPTDAGIEIEIYTRFCSHQSPLQFIMM